MANNVVHFAVHADDLHRARRFYEAVFGWRFEPWGPPDFLLITTGTEADPGIRGALQKRREPVTGTGMTGYECTIAVAAIGETAAAVEAHGGTILVPVCEIRGVGRLIQFRDPEGNVVCAMQYEQSA